MKADFSYTDESGITTRLSFSADHSALTQQFGASECESSASDLAESFEQSLQEIPKVLLQAHCLLLLSLSSASCDLLKTEIEEVVPGQAKEERK